MGLGFANFVKPGLGVQLKAGPSGLAATSTTFAGILEHTFPTSIIKSMADGEVLQIVVFAFLFGMACATIGSKAEPVVKFCESLSRGDVQIHRLHHVRGSVRRVRSDGGDRSATRDLVFW